MTGFFDWSILAGLGAGLVFGFGTVMLTRYVLRTLSTHIEADVAAEEDFYPPVSLLITNSGRLDWVVFAVQISMTLLVFHFAGVSTTAFAMALFCMVSLTLAHVDIRTGLLPDALTLPLLGLGLLEQGVSGWSALIYAVAGGLVAYGLLRLVFGLFHWKTGRAGMGFGDFKLAAAIGAWVGVQAVPTVLLIASLSGVVFGLLARCFRYLPAGNAFPFGPFLAVAGILTLLWTRMFS